MHAQTNRRRTHFHTHAQHTTNTDLLTKSHDATANARLTSRREGGEAALRLLGRHVRRDLVLDKGGAEGRVPCAWEIRKARCPALWEDRLGAPADQKQEKVRRL